MLVWSFNNLLSLGQSQQQVILSIVSKSNVFFTFVCYYNEKLMKLNCTLLLIAISTIVFAQNEWKPGYILKTQQDTVWGSLQNKNYNENSHAITFRTDENEQPSTYLPDDIYGYRFKEGKFYVSK